MPDKDAISSTEPLTLHVVKMRSYTAGDSRVSFTFMRSRENHQIGKAGLHIGLNSDTMTLREWADAFENIARQCREWPVTFAGVQITHLDMDFPR